MRKKENAKTERVIQGILEVVETEYNQGSDSMDILVGLLVVAQIILEVMLRVTTSVPPPKEMRVLEKALKLVLD